jgi:hypothetical protein
MVGANCGVDSAQDDFGLRCVAVNCFDHFTDTEIPVSHAGLYERVVEGKLRVKKVLQFEAWQSKAMKLPGSFEERCRLLDRFGIECAPSPRIAAIFPRRHAVIEPVEKVE